MNRLFNRLNVSLLLVLLSATLGGFFLLPESSRLPIHWNMQGVVDRFLPRNQALLLLPLVAVALTAAFWGIERVIRKSGHAEVGRQFAVGLSVVLGLFAVIQVVIVLAGVGHSVDMARATTIVVALGLIIQGNLLPKSRPSDSRFTWPKALNHPLSLYRVQRMIGVLMILSGLGLLVAVLLMSSTTWFFSLQALSVVGPVVVGVAFACCLPSAEEK